MSRKVYLLFTFFHLFLLPSYSQVTGGFKDERALYAETKQLNQFFRRFNNEEDLKGNRLYPQDSAYRKENGRLKYLSILFDMENPYLKKNLVDSFTQEMISKKIYLEFHDRHWEAETKCQFQYKGKTATARIFLKLQKEKIGSKWVMDDIRFYDLSSVFNRDTSQNKYFLHPLSHEIDFMNLYKVFNFEKTHIQDYSANSFQPDEMTLFLYLVKKGEIKFITVDEVKFHFYNIPGWYMEVSKFNRSGNNTGWLISKLLRSSEQEKNILQEYIHAHQ